MDEAMSDSEDNKKDSDSSNISGYQFFDATKDYAFTSLANQAAATSSAPVTTSDTTPPGPAAQVAAKGQPKAPAKAVTSAPAAPVAPAPVPAVAAPAPAPAPAVQIHTIDSMKVESATTPPPPPLANESPKSQRLQFSPNFNFSQSLVRVFIALDIDLSNRLSKKELQDGMAGNKLHGDEYLLAMTLLDYYDEIHKNLFGEGGPDMGCSVEEILTYIGEKPRSQSELPPEIKEIRGMKQNTRRAPKNPWSRY